MSATIDLRLDLWPRQLQALNTDATEVLFGGASEGGKSHLVRVALIVWCLGIKELQCTLIRKKFADIISNHVEGPTGFRSLLRPLIDCGAVKITLGGVRFLSTGSLIEFKHCQDERQFDSAQGVEKHVLCIEEATQIPERLIRMFRGWVRMTPEFKLTIPKDWRNKFPKILYTANPVGVSVGFFRRNFVKARPTFAIERVEGFLRQYIPSRAVDNLSVDMDAHRGRLAGIGDAALAKALDEGDWDAPVGDFLREWSEDKHVVPDFLPPSHWFRFRSFDWGSAEPFAVYWWAVSDGESFADQLGRKRWFPKGAIIAYREWYGCQPDDPAKGLRMRNEDIASGILALSPAEYEKRVVTLSDGLPFQDRGGKTIAETFAENGVLLTHGDTKRIPGWSQLRARLIGAKIDVADTDTTPMIYFVESCKYARDYVPALPRHKTRPEDAAEDGEATHSCDAIRLACMARARVVEAEPPPPNTEDAHNDLTFEQAIQRIAEYKEQQGGIRY